MRLKLKYEYTCRKYKYRTKMSYTGYLIVYNDHNLVDDRNVINKRA